MPGPLTGIRVLDLTRLIPGGVCAMLMAQMSADVVKVEDPNGGDYARWMPPLMDGQGALFHATNRGKRSMILNLKHEDGQAVLKKLVASADVLIESYRPGVMSRLNCGYEDLKMINPRLVFCALSGWGQDGPYVDRSGHDLNYLAISGMLANGQQHPLGGQVADVGGAYAALSAILAALFQRECGGDGGFLDISLFESALPFIMQPWVEALTAEQNNDPQGLLTGAYACYNVYEAKDGKRVTLAALEPKFWANFANAVERADLLVDDHVAPEIQDDLRAKLSGLFAAHSAAEWDALLNDADCCFAIVNELDHALNDPHIQARGMMSVSDEDAPLMSSPIRFGADPIAGKPAPGYGEHTREVLAAAGYSDTEIDALDAAGAIKIN